MTEIDGYTIEVKYVPPHVAKQLQEKSKELREITVTDFSEEREVEAISYYDSFFRVLNKFFCCPCRVSYYTYSLVALLVLVSIVLLTLVILTITLTLDQSTKEFMYIFVALVAGSLISLVSALLSKIKQEDNHVFVLPRPK